MKQFLISLLTALVTVAISFICSFAQNPSGTVVRRIGGPGSHIEGEPFNLAELGAIIAKDSVGLRVIFAGSHDTRPKAYQDVDLRQDDLILMMNGKKLTTTAELTKEFEAAKIGDNLQFGIKRDGQLMVISFPKADPATLPSQRHMVMMKSDGGKGGTQIKIGGKDLKIPDGIDGVEPVPGLGLLVGTKDEKLVVAAVMPFMRESGEFKSLAGGDQITSVSGKPVTTTADFIAAYTALKVGEKFEFKALHAGKEASISIAKPADEGVRIIDRK